MVSFHKVREHFRKKGETHVDTYERGQGSPAVAPSGPYVAPSESRPKEPSLKRDAARDALVLRLLLRLIRNDRQLKKEIAEAQKKKAEKEAKIEADAINAKRKQEEIESKARESGWTELLALSTQAFTYFQSKGGFVEGSPNDLPAARRDKYDQSGRKSKVLVKRLAK